MFRGAYGVLRLTPRQLRELTPGEYGDMMEARIWAVGGKEPSRELLPHEKHEKLRQLDARIQRARG